MVTDAHEARTSFCHKKMEGRGLESRRARFEGPRPREVLWERSAECHELRQITPGTKPIGMRVSGLNSPDKIL